MVAEPSRSGDVGLHSSSYALEGGPSDKSGLESSWNCTPKMVLTLLLFERLDVEVFVCELGRRELVVIREDTEASTIHMMSIVEGI